MMVGLSFSFPKLLLKIYTGEKAQTIRVENPKRIEQMKRLGIQLFWKQRSKFGFKLNETRYKEGFKLMFRRTSCRVRYKYTLHTLEYDESDDWWAGALLSERKEIAVLDGFDNYEELVDALESRYGDLDSMIFDLIRWPRLKKPNPRIDVRWRHQMMILGLIKSPHEVKWMEKYEMGHR